MYLYQYPMNPFSPMMCGNCIMPQNYPGYAGMEDEAYRSSETEEYDFTEDSRGENTAGIQFPKQAGKGHSSYFPENMSMAPGMMEADVKKSDMMSHLNTLQSDITAQINALQKSSFSAALKQTQIEAPQIINALIALGTSIETLRQIILRIVEAANKEQQ